MRTKGVDAMRKPHLVMVSCGAAAATAALLLLGLVGLFVSAPGPGLRNWLVILFQINAGIGSLPADPLRVLHPLDLTILILVSLTFLGLRPASGKASRLWMALAAALPLAGLAILLITGLAGRSAVMVAGLVASGCMFRSRGSRRLAGLGIAANALLLAGDLATGGTLSPFVAVLVGMGYILLAAWFLGIGVRAPRSRLAERRSRRASAALLLALGLALFSPHATSGEAHDSPEKTPTGAVRLGYYTGDERSFEAVRAFASYLTAVSVDVFAVQPDGTIVGEDDLGVVAFARIHGVLAYACVSNYNSDADVEDFDPAWAHAAIVTHKDAVIDRLLAIAQEGDYDGVNVDLENLAYSRDIAADRVAFTAFIHDLALRLHAADLGLVISVPGKTYDSRDDDWSYPFDYVALGRDADYLQLMTYDQHGPWSEPGPVSGADWVSQCVAYAATVVDPAKLLIGLPAYGYDWDLTVSRPARGTYSATSFSWIDLPALLAKPGIVMNWNAVASAPSLTYREKGRRHEAWYENEESLRAKTELIGRYGLAGLSMWSLGQEDEAFWQAVTAPPS